MPLEIRQSVTPHAILAGSAVAERPVLAWLGQAGFVLRCGEIRLVIDPYLSDSLAIKYHGKPLAHRRMMPSPIEPAEVRPLDAVLCTHAHSDHLDPGTLPILAAGNPQCRFVVPRAALATALQRGVPAERAVPINAGESFELTADIVVEALPSAHEQLEQDAEGNHRFLGYVVRLPGLTVYHSGDCVPYPGLVEELARRKIDLTLLPVNGRDEFRLRHGILGNFWYSEAEQLCCAAGIRCLVACHYGMFDFNTVEPAGLDAQIARAPAALQVIPARIGEAYQWN